MKVSNKFRRPERSGERGVTMVLVALAMVAIVAMAAMSIDLVTLYLAREEAQRSADAAALAAARVISVSGITGTGDPTNPTYTAHWAAICGAGSKTTPAGVATLAAQAVGGQNSVGSTAATVNVTYSVGSNTPVPDCSTLGAQFAVNPLVTVQVQRQSLPTFFSRLWGITGNNVSATAVAEVFNSSGSDTYAGGNVTPVQPRCVKPWMVPNIDPGASPLSCVPNGSGPTACKQLVTLADGTIQNPGVSPSGVIGETINLFADCASSTSGCTLQDNTLRANVGSGSGPYNGTSPPLMPPPNLEYLAGASPASVIAAPSCTQTGIGGNTDYEPAVTACDHTTVYKCGVPGGNSIDLSENPGGPSGDTSTATQCLIGQSSGTTVTQDVLNTGSFPFTITAGSSNLVKPPAGSFVTSSNSIVSLPIYESKMLNPSLTTNTVTVVGYLQVFINQVNSTDGSLNVTVLNVAGCGNDADNPAITGSSPVPIRLVTPQ